MGNVPHSQSIRVHRNPSQKSERRCPAFRPPDLHPGLASPPLFSSSPPSPLLSSPLPLCLAAEMPPVSPLFGSRGTSIFFFCTKPAIVYTFEEKKNVKKKKTTKKIKNKKPTHTEKKLKINNQKKKLKGKYAGERSKNPPVCTEKIYLQIDRQKKKVTITYLLYILFYYKSCLVYCILYICCGL